MSDTRLCSICQSPLGDDESQTACPECRTPYHQECWDENQGCAIYGCSQVPPTEKREDLEIPPAFWGQEDKRCPVCNETILAAAVRCRHCGATFASARPEDKDQYDERVSVKHLAPALRRKTVILFMLCAIPAVSAIGALWGMFWYRRNRKGLASLPAVYPALAKVALGLGAGQTLFLIVVLIINNYT